MPLHDLVRYLNAQLPYLPSGSRSTMPFVSEGGRIFVNYAGVRLESEFSSLVTTFNAELKGHQAHLQAIDETTDQLLDPVAIERLPNDDKEFIFFDRLVRTLHTLNYLTYGDRQSRELLLLKVHPRHVASVAADHGLAFEEILRSCGLMPEQITLEFNVDSGVDAAHLVRAIDNYRSRGYGIAIGHLGLQDIDHTLLSAIRPSIVSLNAGLLSQVEPIGYLIDLLHKAGSLVMIEGLNTEALRDDARQNGVDLLQVQGPSGRMASAPATSFSSSTQPYGATRAAA